MKKIWLLDGSVYPKELGYRRFYESSWWRRMFCKHLTSATFARSTGPSYMDDSFKGQVCTACGSVLAEMRTY